MSFSKVLHNDLFEDFVFCREFKVMNLLEFSSKRKRMSVVVRDELGQIFLLCKGADRYDFVYMIVLI